MTNRITFVEYLKKIAAAYFERKFKADKGIYKLLKVLGNAIETARSELRKAISQYTLGEAGGEYLDRHGADRRLPRVIDETDADYRTFLLGARDLYQYLASAPDVAGACNMTVMLARFNFIATVTERWKGYGPQGPIYSRPDWNMFDVLLTVSDTYPENVFFNLVRRCKPAHTRSEYQFGPGVLWKTFDDWNIILGDDYPWGDTEQTFDDGGTFDDF